MPRRVLILLVVPALFGVLPTVASAGQACSNEALRTGFSASLPDCRAYELVTPPGTEGRRMRFALDKSGSFDLFSSQLASPSGESFVYVLQGQPLEEVAGNSGVQDVYEAVRSAGGWGTVRRLTASGQQAAGSNQGGVSSDHSYSFLLVPGGVGGSLSGADDTDSNYLLHPDGAFELIGVGSVEGERVEEPWAEGFWISPGGAHIIFGTKAFHCTGSCEAKQLEPMAPPTGTGAIYDRAPDGPTRVVSLLPGDVTPAGGERAIYQGASADGSVVAFRIGEFLSTGPLYVRVDDSHTLIVPGGAQGETLTCAAGPGGATLGFEWLRNGAPIPGQTSSTYTTSAADEGAAVQCRVSASTGEGASRIASASKLVGPAGLVAPPEPATPGVSGTLTVGQTLTCNPSAWSGSPTFAYQWLRNGAPIAGATASSYTLVSADDETAVQCEVTGSNAGGAAVGESASKLVRSEPPVNTGTTVNAPAVTGTATVGETLSCSNGTWTGASSFAYRWLRNGVAIAGQTVSTYTLEAADEGKAVQCEVSGTNMGGSGVAISANKVIAPSPSPLPPTRPGSALSVTGTRRVGQTLTCAAGTWGNSPTGFAYQWLRNGVEIAAATSTSYTLVSADLDRLVQCRVTASNAGGASSATSPATQVNVVVNNPPSATASIGGGRQTFAGLSADGGSLFFVQGGDVFDFDTSAGTVRRVSEVGDAEIVNVSADGSHVYFISHKQIGGEGSAGEPNLYVWDAASDATTYVATVAASDLSGRPALNNWTTRVVVSPMEVPSTEAGPGYNSSRTTPDGSVIAFESAAKLTSYENAGHTEVYRYDTRTPNAEVECVSCNPDGEPASANARFEATSTGAVSTQQVVFNLSEDGERVFFETPEALVGGDIDNVNDVYEWSAGGEPGLSLVSSGLTTTYSDFSGETTPSNWISAITPSGSDVFFVTGDALAPGADGGGALAIYDARVGGGFSSPIVTPCVGEACQPVFAAPATVGFAPASVGYAGSGNVVVSKPAAKPKPKPKAKRKSKAKRKRKAKRRGKQGRAKRSARPRRAGGRVAGRVKRAMGGTR